MEAVFYRALIKSDSDTICPCILKNCGALDKFSAHLIQASSSTLFLKKIIEAPFGLICCGVAVWPRPLAQREKVALVAPIFVEYAFGLRLATFVVGTFIVMEAIKAYPYVCATATFSAAANGSTG